MFGKFAALGLVIAPLFAVAQTIETPPAQVVEEIVAKVNGDIITRGELEEKHKEAETALKGQGASGAKLASALKEVDAEALRDEIDTLLLVQEGKNLPGLTVDSDVTRFFNNLQAQVHITDPDKFHQWLREQSGMSYEELKDRKKREILSQRVVSYQVSSRLTVSEADLHKYYDEHKADYVREEEVFLSQILLSTEGKTPAQVAAAEAKAKDLVARARRGDKFSELVRDNSDDTVTAQNGGYLGAPSKRGTLRPEIEAIVFKEKKGYISDPIKTPAGILILKVEDHYEAGQASFEEVRDQIQEALLRARMEPKLREYLTQLRQGAFLQIKEGYVDSGAAPGKDTRWQDVAPLRPQSTTKEEVASRSKPHKKILFIPIPGTTAPMKTLAETEKAPKAPKHRKRPSDVTPEAVESNPGPKIAARQGPPMVPIKQ